MSETTVVTTPSLSTFLKFLKHRSVDSSIENLISLLKRRQIKGSRTCAIATAKLMRRVVAEFKVTDVEELIKRVQRVGKRLAAAQPREISVGNIVRRVLGLIRDEAEEDRDENKMSNFSPTSSGSRPGTPAGSTAPPRFGFDSPGRNARYRMTSSAFASISEEAFTHPVPEGFHRPPLLTSHTSYAANNTAPTVTSMFNLLSHPISNRGSPILTPGNQSPAPRHVLSKTNLASIPDESDIRAEVIDGIDEIIDELDVVDDQIAAYALEHIHANEIILIYGSSMTVQKFLLKAASKRKFTVIHAEAYPNNHEETHATIMGKHTTWTDDDDDDDEETERSFSKPLIAAGITVIMISDAAVFSLMSRVNKVILGTHVVLANGGLVAAAGAKAIAKAASVHKTPVVVVTGIYKLSPEYPFDFESLIEYGDASKVLAYEEGDLVDKVDVENPLYDYVPAELVDLYITNIGGHAPSYLYRIVADHYRTEDTNLGQTLEKLDIM